MKLAPPDEVLSGGLQALITDRDAHVRILVRQSLVVDMSGDVVTYDFVLEPS
jgi:hypothetical protein